MKKIDSEKFRGVYLPVIVAWVILVCGTFVIDYTMDGRDKMPRDFLYATALALVLLGGRVRRWGKLDGEEKARGEISLARNIGLLATAAVILVICVLVAEMLID